LTLFRRSPLAPLFQIVKHGTPFGKGSLGAILGSNVFTVMRLLIITVEDEFFESRIFNFRS
jgi:hypothetical protein